jgi:hypothetical protein
VFLLNNDIEITEGIFDKLTECFNDPSAFAVQSKIVSSQKEEKSNEINIYYSKFGIFIYKYVKVEADTLPVQIGFASGGASMFDKNKLLSLNLFDEKFSPFYAEDLDLSFRAKLWGWKTLFLPTTVSYHRHIASTINANYSLVKRKIIHTRNIFFFYWKHLPVLKIFPLCIITVPLYLLYKLLRGNPWYLFGFVASLFGSSAKPESFPVVPGNALYIGETPSETDRELLASLRTKDTARYLFAVFSKKQDDITHGIPVFYNDISPLNPVSGFIRSFYLIKTVKPELIHCRISSFIYCLSWVLAARILNVPVELHFLKEQDSSWKTRILYRICALKEKNNADKI